MKKIEVARSKNYCSVLIPIFVAVVIMVLQASTLLAQCPPQVIENNVTGDTEFGRFMAFGGDVNNDGYDDLLVAAHLNSRVLVISGKTGGIIYNIDEPAKRVAGGIDINNDGYDDYLASHPSYPGGDTGTVWIYSGATGDVMHTLKGDTTDQFFGSSISGAGDVNGDGHGDFIVGATEADYPNPEVRTGYIRVYSGADWSILFEKHGESPGDTYGASVAGLGDINGDGYDDVVVGAYNNDANGNQSGRAYVYTGPAGNHRYTKTGAHAGANFGSSVAWAGDINSDGFDDILVGAPRYGVTDTVGRVYLYSGSTGTLMKTFTGHDKYDHFGLFISGAGDVNQDGFNDIIIGAYHEALRVWMNSTRGQVYIYSGADYSQLHHFVGEEWSRLGYGVTRAGDMNSDGYDDVAYAVLWDAGLGDPEVHIQHFSPNSDTDALPDVCDNCLLDDNPSQTDIDGDGLGAVCDCDDSSPIIGPKHSWFQDLDSDGYGNPGISVFQCDAPAGYIEDGTDCDDTDPNEHPNLWWYADADGDGFGNATSSNSCERLDPTDVTDNTDCDDNDPTEHPGIIWYADADGDSFGDPSNSNPCEKLLSSDVINNYDCNDSDPTLNPNTVWYADTDGDGYGDASVTLTQCSQPGGYIANNSDCNDSDPAINPTTIWFEDSDGDGFGNNSVTLSQCTQPAGFILENGDCNDSDPALNPTTIWYEDIDSDGFGDPSVSINQCQSPAGYVLNATDNCINVSNAGQEDSNSDGLGDACTNTETGFNILHGPNQGVTLNFDQVNQAGWTEVTLYNTGPSPPAGYQLIPTNPDVYYEISTTALFSGIVEVCIIYDEAYVIGDESNLSLWHFDGGILTEVSVNVYPLENKICGEVISLSPFFVAQRVGCCGEFTSGQTGNTNCDAGGLRDLADITRLIDNVYISKTDLCCQENGNINGDVEGLINLADITKLIDHVYISKTDTAVCD